ncbi:Sortilin, neurotensin receptor 3 [Popillia japonica]|uniref:Sortilin, neurotensin receptor 3 n=1 Tax=Popillia japonica TaxID=7064 RepID=A0AAW1KSC9_POPJA
MVRTHRWKSFITIRILIPSSYSSVEKFYNHPNFNSHFVFTDVRNKHIFVTTDHGKHITKIQVRFTPSEVQFRELHPRTILVLDKASSGRELYYSVDFGQSFSLLEENVKSFTFTNDKWELVLQRMLPSNFSSIYHTNNSPLTRPMTFLTKDVVEMFVKGDYVFFTKKSTSYNYDLFVSYKFKSIKQCIFDTQLTRQAYQIVDITNDRALVSVSHSDMTSHLYVSESLSVEDDTIRFTLSLENVLAYFPNNTWPDTWLHHVAEEPFTDIYKVEGLSGIYIASQVSHIPPSFNLGPQHLVTKITFDHGRSWNFIRAPARDNDRQLIPCDLEKNCSLHLSQRFSQLYPDTRTVSILSSKSAPGILVATVATGVIGKSLKGHFGVYISTNAGLTWKQALKDLYFFNMGDRGGILTAVKYYKVRRETRYILYSINEGEKWNEIPFHDEEIRLYGLMTEPGENTTIFTMFGSLPEEHKWIIVKINLQSVFDGQCKPEDYKDWTPSTIVNGESTIPCNMGQQSVYKRRLGNVSCYNGENNDFPISVQPCECTAVDYEW